MSWDYLRPWLRRSMISLFGLMDEAIESFEECFSRLGLLRLVLASSISLILTLKRSCCSGSSIMISSLCSLPGTAFIIISCFTMSSGSISSSLRTWSLSEEIVAGAIKLFTVGSMTGFSLMILQLLRFLGTEASSGAIFNSRYVKSLCVSNKCVRFDSEWSPMLYICEFRLFDDDLDSSPDSSTVGVF